MVSQKDLNVLMMYGAKGVEVSLNNSSDASFETKTQKANISMENLGSLESEKFDNSFGDILCENSKLKYRLRIDSASVINLGLSNMKDSMIESDLKVNAQIIKAQIGIDNEKFLITNVIEKLHEKMNWHCVLVGESGMGKTTSLLKFWEDFNKSLEKRPIPLFIDISKYNTSRCKDDFIIRFILKEYVSKIRACQYEDIVWEFLRYPYEKDNLKYPVVVLLIDGFNEVTADNKKFKAELDYIKENMNGVQIIITASTDIRGNFEWNDFNKIELMPLQDEQIKKFLSIREQQKKPLDECMKNVLRKPMMTALYKNTAEIMREYRQNEYFEWKEHPETQGEIIWNYIEAQLSKKVENGEEEIRYYEFLIKHLTAYIAFVMEKSGVYYLDESDFKAAVNTALRVLENNSFYEIFEKYVYCEHRFKLQANTHKEKVERFDKIKNILIKDIGFIKMENKEYKFVHRKFRDYFSALHILNEIIIGIFEKNISRVLKERPLHFYIREFIGEIEGENYNRPYETYSGWKISYDGKDNLEKMLDMLRDKFDSSVGYTVWNIIEIWKVSRGELSGCNLSHLDLSNLMINGTRCSRGSKNCLAADFNGSIINEKSIFSYGHISSVSSVAIRDGKIMSGSWDTTIKIWNMNTGELISTLEGHQDSVYSIAARDDKIISGSWDKTVKVWDINTGELINTLKGHSGSLYGVAAAEGKVVSCSNDRTIRVWDVSTGELLNVLEGHQGAVYGVAIKDGKIVSCSNDKTIKIWDSKTGEVLRTLMSEVSTVSSLAIMEGKIALGSGDKTVKIWDVNTGNVLNVLEGHTDYVSSVVIRDGKIVSGSGDQTVKIWDVNTGELLYTLEGHTSCVYSVAAREGRIVSGSLDNTIKIWDLNTGRLVNTLENIAGLFVKGCDFSNLHSKSELSDKNLKILKMYGVKLLQ